MVFQQIIAVLSIAFPSKIIYLCLMIVETLLSLCHKIYVRKFCITHIVTGHLVTLAFSRLIAEFWKGFGGLNSTDMLKHLSLRLNFVKRQKPVVKWDYDRGEAQLFQLVMQQFGVKKLWLLNIDPKPMAWQNKVIVASRTIWGNTLTAKDLNNLIGFWWHRGRGRRCHSWDWRLWWRGGWCW